MMVFVAGGTTTVRRLAPLYPDHLGLLLEPIGANSLDLAIELNMPWAAANGARDGLSRPAYERMLDRIEGVEGCNWVAAPDVHGKAAETLALFHFWLWRLRGSWLPAALCAQDGLESLDVPWDLFHCLFVAGSVAWKLSGSAADLVREARRRRKWVHLTQVNSFARLRAAYALGVHSVDGISCTRFGDTYLARFLAAIAGEERQRRWAF